MSSPSASSIKSPLQAAQNIVAELTGMTSEHQSLALKFAIETLGLQVAAAATSPTAAPIHPSPNVVTPTAGTEHSGDIRSFTALKAPKSDRQFAAVVAYFYQFEAKQEERRDTIDAATMKEAARLAGRPQVQRWNMTLTNAKNAGYLDTAGSGKFKLSSVGENLVAITLPNDSGATTRLPGKTTKKVKRNSNKGIKKKH